MSKKDKMETETKTEPKKVEKMSSSKKAKSAFYYAGTHFKKGDDLSKLKKEDLEFLTKKGKVE